MIACMYMYIQNGNFVKNHDNLHGSTYRIKIMLNGFAMKKDWLLR